MKNLSDFEAMNRAILSLNLSEGDKFKLIALKGVKKVIYELIQENNRLKNKLGAKERDKARYQVRKKNTPKLEYFKGFKSIEKFDLKTLKRLEVYYNLRTCSDSADIHITLLKSYIVDGKGGGFGWRFVANEKACILCNEFKVESTNYQVRDKKLNYYYSHCLKCDDKIKVERNRKAKERRKCSIG